MELSLSPSDISSLVNAKEVRGATSEIIRGIASLSSARAGDLSFLGNQKYKSEVVTTQASLVLLPLDYAGEPQSNQTFFLVDKPSVALAQICSKIEQVLWPKPTPGIHTTAVVAPTATIAPTATVGPHCIIEAGAKIGEGVHLQARVFVGRNAVIGDDSWLMPGVVVATECVLRERVRLQPGVVVGADGFGYEFVGGRHEKIPQIGRVVIERDVEIGANSTLDRARFSETRIGEGTKIDNLVQIAHNVIVGKHCIICAQAGISGSTTVEDYVIVGGQAGLAGHLNVGRGSKIDGQTGVNSDLEPNSFVKGSPCLPYSVEQRVNVLRKRLPELFKRVDALEDRLK
jgi:UDP-3-O-[3-hydroxymyristoyl] glucosamine N-acyltransferase